MRKVEQSFSKTFHGFDKFMRSRFSIIVIQVTRRQWNVHFKRTVVHSANPVRLHIAFGHICENSFHFDLCHRLKLTFCFCTDIGFRREMSKFSQHL